MTLKKLLQLALGIAIAGSLVGTNAFAAQTNVAVAANFTDAAKEIAAAFKQKTGHEAVLSFGSAGQFYTQITQDAPFQILLSADDERPEEAGRATASACRTAASPTRSASSCCGARIARPR